MNSFSAQIQFQATSILSEFGLALQKVLATHFSLFEFKRKTSKIKITLLVLPSLAKAAQRAAPPSPDCRSTHRAGSQLCDTGTSSDLPSQLTQRGCS